MRITILLIFITIGSQVFSQNLIKLSGDWYACGWNEVEKIDSLVLCKKLAITDPICQLNACTVTNWSFENWDFKFKLFIGCPNDALGQEYFNWSSWNYGVDPSKKTIWIIDDHMRCYYFKIIDLTDKIFKIIKDNRS